MSLQLEQMGEEVMLSMMDAPAPGAKKKRGRVAGERLNRLGHLFSKEQEVQSETVQLKTTQLKTIQSKIEPGANSGANRKGRSQLKKVWQKGTNVLRYEALSKSKKALVSLQAYALTFCQERNWSIPQVLQSLSIRDLLIFAYEHYQPTQTFGGQVLLIRATCGDGSHADRPYIEEYVDPSFGWQDFCERAITLQDAPGGHSTMLKDENVDVIAKAIEAQAFPPP